MQRQFKTARKMCKMKLFEAAELLGVSQPTLSSWESGRKSPTIDSVLKMAALYNISTDFLLGNSLMGKVEENRKTDRRIPCESLRIMHGQPVWSNEHGWMLVDSINNCLIAPDSVQSLKFAHTVPLHNGFTGVVHRKTFLMRKNRSYYSGKHCFVHLNLPNRL